MTQENLAAKTGISRASIANIERGRQNVALHHVYNIASALEVSEVSDLLPSLMTAKSREEKTMMPTSNTLTEKGKAQVNELVRKALRKKR